MLITSLDNKKIKEINKLRNKKYRDLEGKFVVETENLIREANSLGKIEDIFLLSGVSLGFSVNCPVTYVTDKVMSKITELRTSKVIAIVSKSVSHEYKGTKYLMLDNISDPGNLGTIIRSAVSFSVDTVIVSLNCCDIYNDKVVRASEGAIFKINIIKEDLEVAICNLRKLKIDIYGTDVNNGIDVCDIKKDNFCVIMGNEGNGISNVVRELVDKNIYIKTNSMESLNVAIAASIILYELSK